MGFPGGSEAKESACNAGNVGLIPGREDPLEKEIAGNHSSYSGLEDPMDSGAWWATVHGVAKNRTGVSG